jgi:glycosyltransferase involved in cell wall biosynthesis
MKKKICFVVHRYAPYPGGSEYYVQQMAEESINRGVEVTVLAGEHKGNLNNVSVTSDATALLNKDLVIVHGGDVSVQDFVLEHIKDINSPVLYLLIKPSDSKTCLQGLKDAKYIGCSSLQDWAHVQKWGQEKKAYKVIHGVSPKSCLGNKNLFKKKFSIPENKKMFLSCGGYWPNKKMLELAEAFTEASPPNALLVTTGYDNRFNLMPTKSDIVIPLMVEDPQDVKNAIADAHCYIMNSDTEGFGLVLLEAMLNKTPWISRNIAGAELLCEHGTVYSTEKELVGLLQDFSIDFAKVEKAYQYVVQNHLIKHTVDDILNILNKV